MILQADLSRIMELAGTDPRFKALAEVLTEKCSACKGTNRVSTSDGEREERCCFCDTGRVLRSWADLPQGALAGALKHWARKTQHDAGMDGNIAYPMRDLADAIGRVFGLPDCNEQAARLVFEVMKKEAAHATE